MHESSCLEKIIVFHMAQGLLSQCKDSTYVKKSRHIDEHKACSVTFTYTTHMGRFSGQRFPEEGYFSADFL